MSQVVRKYDKVTFARMGDAAYENIVQPQLSDGDRGKYVAIDIDTNDFQIDADEMRACDQLRERNSQAQIWLVKIGSRYLHRFGYRLTFKGMKLKYQSDN